MTKPKRFGSIEIAQDMDFQRASWRVQRAGWIVMLIIVIAALLGVFGGGPLSSARAGGSGSGITVKYERFIRAQAGHTLDFEIAPAVQSDSIVRIWLSSDWTLANEIMNITPEPSSATLEDGKTIYAFRSARSGTPLSVRFNLKARVMGLLNGQAGLVEGQSHSFRQFAYP